MVRARAIGAILITLAVMLWLPAHGVLAAEAAVSNGYAPPPPKEGFSYPDCYCTDSDGQRVEIGERACLDIGGRAVTAECRMSLNSPAWRTVADGCPVS